MDVVDKLQQIANCKPGDPMPECLGGDQLNWAAPLAKLCGDAAVEMERLRTILRQCVRGPDIVEIRSGEVLGLHLAHKGESFADIRDRLRAGNAV